MTSTKILALATAIALGGAGTANAATLTVSNGILTGATGVTIGNNVYNVEFKDGTCLAVYGGICDVGAFDFTDSFAANLAANALLNQVFIDGSQGNFDSDPSKTFGCGDSLCVTRIAYERQSSFASAQVLNFAGAGDQVGNGRSSPREDFGADSTANFARFTFVGTVPVAAGVPEPATWAMMMLGFGGMGYTLRRRSNVDTRIRFA